jgi:hypothetical protein
MQPGNPAANCFVLRDGPRLMAFETFWLICSVSFSRFIYSMRQMHLIRQISLLGTFVFLAPKHFVLAKGPKFSVGADIHC